MKSFGLVLITLLVSTPAWAMWPAAPIATVTGQSTDGFNGSAVTGAMNSTGAKVFIAAISRQYNCTTPGIQDNMGNTWILYASSNAAGMGPRADIWWAKAVHTGAGHTFQPNNSGCPDAGESYPSIAVMAWNNSENSLGAILDQVVAGAGSTTSPITADVILPTTTDQMVVSVATGGITSSSWGGVSAGFTAAAQIPQGPNAYTLAVGYQIQTTPTSVNPAWTWGGTGMMIAMNVSFFNHIDLGCTGSGLSWTSTPDQPSMQSCVTQAPAGATVNISAGTSPAFIDTPVSWSSKKLTIKGAGVGATILQGQGQFLVVYGASAANFADISGITFRTDPVSNTYAASIGIVEVDGAATGTFEDGFRIHHNDINVISSGRGIAPKFVYGLIDHNTFERGCSCQLISPEGSSTSADGGFTPWTVPLTLGTYNAQYIENNTFDVAVDGEDSIDAYAAARFVIRANTFIDSHIGWHGTDSGGNRSPVSWETYGNQFINNTTSAFRGSTIRGGTGVQWGNTFGGSRGFWNPFALIYYRATIPYLQSWNYCDGTNWDLGVRPDPSCAGKFLGAGPATDMSACVVPAGTGARFLSTNEEIPCMGAVTGTCTRFLDGPGFHGYPCRDQPGRAPGQGTVAPGQVLTPVYEWTNGSVHIGTYDGGGDYPPNNMGISIGNWMLENREYYNYGESPNQAGCNTSGTCPFTGTPSSGNGVGVGKRADRPTSCTTGVAYWSVDQGSWNPTNDVRFKTTLASVDYYNGVLDVCTATNTWTNAWYTPANFPHPLDITPTPPPPTISAGGRLRRR